MNVKLRQGQVWSYIVGLFHKPKENVQALIYGGGDGLIVAPTQLNFTPHNWRVPQVATIYARSDAKVGTRVITHQVRSPRPNYRSKKELTIEVTVCDANDPSVTDDLPGLRMDLSVYEIDGGIN